MLDITNEVSGRDLDKLQEKLKEWIKTDEIGLDFTGATEIYGYIFSGDFKDPFLLVLLAALVTIGYRIDSLREYVRTVKDLPTEWEDFLYETKIVSPTVVETIYVSAGRTLNVGNYESARIDVGVTLRNKNGKANVPDMIAEAWELVVREVTSKSLLIKAKTDKGEI